MVYFVAGTHQDKLVKEIYVNHRDVWNSIGRPRGFLYYPSGAKMFSYINPKVHKDVIEPLGLMASDLFKKYCIAFNVVKIYTYWVCPAWGLVLMFT